MCEKLGQKGKYSIHYLIVADKQRKQPKYRASTRPYILHGLECSLIKLGFVSAAGYAVSFNATQF